MSRLKEYESTIPLGDALVSQVGAIVGTLRERGHPVLNTDANGLPESVTVRWEVGDPDGIPDMWELRDVVAEVEVELDQYLQYPCKIGKPREVGG